MLLRYYALAKITILLFSSFFVHSPKEPSYKLQAGAAKRGESDER
jgi:hypothetical protein